jgi:hypothetical protein
MRQSFKDLAAAEREKQKLHYEALIRTESYRSLVDKAFTTWAKAGNLDFNQCEVATARERFFAEPNLEASLLANNLKIPYLFDPDKELPEVAVSMSAVRTIRRQDPKFLVEETPPAPGIKLRPIDSKISPPSKKEFVPLKPFKKNGRYLLTEIDLHATKEKILAEIEFLIKIHKTTVETSTPQQKIYVSSKHKHSPFKIYDMAKTDKNLIQITWELFPEVNGINPNYDEDSKKHYEEIRRLHSKAKNLIEKAEESIPKSLKPRLRRQGNAEKDKSPA